VITIGEPVCPPAFPAQSVLRPIVGIIVRFLEDLGGWKASLICEELPVVSKFEKLVGLLL
jgi:hypothetical protein